MSDLRKAAADALECLSGVALGKYDGNAGDVCVALRAALAQDGVCGECGGTGELDSGGTYPWGEPAMIRCPCTERPAALAQEAEPVVHGTTLWLWKHGEHYLAFRHLYPCFTPGGDPQTLGEPVGWAEFRESHDRAGKGGY